VAENVDAGTVFAARLARAQFGEMLQWSARGWRPAPAGRKCPECGGSVWMKAERRFERHSCTRCCWSKEYRI